MKAAIPALAVILAALFAVPAAAQLAPPSVTTPPPMTYGYVPYNPSNPTGFSHPNGMGYGSYHNPNKIKGHRFNGMKGHRFRGY